MKPGDTVVLKSGGPLMTVECVSLNTGGVKCCWFTDDKTCVYRWFSPELLSVRKGPEIPE